ncbi:sarcosine oxidase subunit delta [Caballeronia sp. DA-9]|uniref:sarcosine oxidase subunit delta n=1 Tax=Caballeronia sp. DA-9 TaxID=3436237 RepID=UPI003F67BEC2
MLLIDCPYCGPRAETEFACGGEAGIQRPDNPESVTDLVWGDYLFMRTNPRGEAHEQWFHSMGCRRWFKANRDTLSYEFKSFSLFGGNAPIGTAKE